MRSNGERSSHDLLTPAVEAIQTVLFDSSDLEYVKSDKNLTGSTRSRDWSLELSSDGSTVPFCRRRRFS